MAKGKPIEVKRGGEPWTQEELDELLERWCFERPLKRSGALMGRTINSMVRKVWGLASQYAAVDSYKRGKRTDRTGMKVTKQEMALVRHARKHDLPVEYIAELLARSTENTKWIVDRRKGRATFGIVG